MQENALENVVCEMASILSRPQCINWAPGSKLQWNFNRNSNIFIEEKTIENVVCEILFISSRPQCDRRQAIIWTYGDF